MNKQQQVKPHYSNDGSLLVHSTFNTIQGEGVFAGRPALFIRLSGCNLQCPLCDTLYESSRKMTVEELLSVANKSGQNLVVLTGGEPLLQNIRPLVDRLLSLYFTVQVETNGTVMPPYSLRDITIMCSPKAKIAKGLADYITAYKYVLKHDDVDASDGLPVHALGNKYKIEKPEKLPFHQPIFIQPVDEKDDVLNKKNLDAAIKSCMLFNYTLCIQIHKIINME